MVNSHVWLLISNRWNSAIAEYALSACRALVRTGVQVTLIMIKGAGFVSRAQEIGVRVCLVPSFQPSSYHYLLLEYRRCLPQVILAFQGIESIAAQLLFPQSRIIRFRGDNRDIQSPGIFKKYFSEIRLSGLLFPSQKIASCYEKNRPSALPIKTIALGCDEKKFRPLKHIHRGHRPVIAIIGRLDPVKGHREFLPVFVKILGQWPKHEKPPFLKIYGEPANLSTQDLLACCCQWGLKQNKDFEIFPKKIGSIEKIMNAVAVGFITSLDSEVICRVATEFLLCGTKVISTQVGSLSQTVFQQGGHCLSLDDMKNHVSFLQKFITTSFKETFEQRLIVAEKARSLYSLDKMSQQLIAELLFL